ncbi:MAG: hypothetical protein QF805_21245, partial [Pirellulaceae bacterium]|nr:hypothetical protein [Pirellulaceae bacterium]
MEASSLLLVFALATTNVGQSFSTEDFAAQNKIYQNWWSTDFETNFDKLPLKGGVEDSHRPYSGYIYPDTGGGTIRTLRKYDAAFNGRRSLATSFEQWDTTSQKERKGRGFFGRGRMRTPHWHGHCNGWAAAAIRHAEPQNSVVRNGYTFTPSDIKALLAEIYIYREEELFPG